jgi:hypothetical protein
VNRLSDCVAARTSNNDLEPTRPTEDAGLGASGTPSLESSLTDPRPFMGDARLDGLDGVDAFGDEGGSGVDSESRLSAPPACTGGLNSAITSGLGGHCNDPNGALLQTSVTECCQRTVVT